MDTTIDNYSLDEMVELFKISKYLTNDDISELNNKMEKINNSQSSIGGEIVSFFKKASMTLKCVNKYRDYMKINDVNYITNRVDDNYIIKRITDYYDFENIADPIILINKIVDTDTEQDKEENILNINNISSSSTHPIVYDTTNTNNINVFR